MIAEPHKQPWGSLLVSRLAKACFNIVIPFWEVCFILATEPDVADDVAQRSSLR